MKKYFVEISFTSHLQSIFFHYLSGLTPNTIYTFVIYGKNYLGHGKRSKEYTITTKGEILNCVIELVNFSL